MKNWRARALVWAYQKYLWTIWSKNNCKGALLEMMKIDCRARVFGMGAHLTFFMDKRGRCTLRWILARNTAHFSKSDSEEKLPQQNRTIDEFRYITDKA